MLVKLSEHLVDPDRYTNHGYACNPNQRCNQVTITDPDDPLIQIVMQVRPGATRFN